MGKGGSLNANFRAFGCKKNGFFEIYGVSARTIRGRGETSADIFRTRGRGSIFRSFVRTALTCRGGWSTVLRRPCGHDCVINNRFSTHLLGVALLRPWIRRFATIFSGWWLRTSSKITGRKNIRNLETGNS